MDDDVDVLDGAFDPVLVFDVAGQEATAVIVELRLEARESGFAAVEDAYDFWVLLEKS